MMMSDIIEMGPVGRKMLSKNFGIYSLALSILFYHFSVEFCLV